MIINMKKYTKLQNKNILLRAENSNLRSIASRCVSLLSKDKYPEGTVGYVLAEDARKALDEYRNRVKRGGKS